MKVLTQAPRRLAIVDDITLRHVGQVDGSASRVGNQAHAWMVEAREFGEAAGPCPSQS